MRTIRTLLILAAATLTFGCDKTLPTASSEEVDIIVGINNSTRTTAGTDTKEDKINNIQVFVYNAEGYLEKSDSFNANYGVMRIVAGQKKIYVIANAPQISGGSNEGALRIKKSKLWENSLDGFVASGNTTTEITTSSTSVTIPIKRLASRIILKKITNARSFGESLPVKAIYLTNVQTSYRLGYTAPTATWVNQLSYQSSSCDDLVYEAFNQTIAYEGSSTTEHRFYCYENTSTATTWGGSWSARPTRLVVQTLEGGTTRYYTYSLGAVRAGYSYTIESYNINRQGATTCDAKTDACTVQSDVTVEPWWETSATVEAYAVGEINDVILAKWREGASYSETF